MQAAKDSFAKNAGPKRSRWLRRLFLGLCVLLIALAGIVGGVWWWSGQSDSLNQTLSRVADWLPADQKLEARGVQGTLRHGGQIEWLRWSNPNLQVEVQSASIDWSLRALFSRALYFGKVDIESLRIHSTPGVKDESPTQPLEDLQLPVRINLPVRIQHFVWEGAPAITLTELDAHYRYTGKEHALEVSSLRYAEGLYKAKAQLQAAAPMQLQAQLEGNLQVALPEQAEKTLSVEATAEVSGTLATQAARLQVNAKAHVPEPASENASDKAALSADISAVILPWQSQVLEQADIELQHINAAWFLPNAPQTDLNGKLQAGPQEKSWQLQATLENLIPGPLDQNSLPVRTMTAKAMFDGQSEWVLESARVELGKKAEEHIQAQGRFNSDTQVFEGKVDVVAINPAEILSTLDAAPVSGQLQATGKPDQSVSFQLNLQAATPRSKQSLYVKTARAEGMWQSPQLQLRDVYLEALDVIVQSKSLTMQTDTQHIEGAIQAKVPGAHAELSLKASPEEGQGKLQLELPSTQQLLAWAKRLPGVEMPDVNLQGNASAQVQWKGGWGKLQQRLLNPVATVQLSGMQVNASVDVPKLQYQEAQGTVADISQLKLLASGSPEALRVELQSHARFAEHELGLDSELTAGLLATPKAHALDWRVQVSRLQAQWNALGESGRWNAALTAPVIIEQTTSGSPVQTQRIKAAAGRINVTPPSNEDEQAASVVWEPLNMQQRAAGNWVLQSKGRLQGLPLIWADTLNPHNPPLAAMGITGDLVFQGEWDIDNTGNAVRANVVLERQSGDIRFTADDGSAANVTIIRSSGASVRNANTNQVQATAATTGRGVRARIQEMRLKLNAQGNDVQAQLVWTTERAGQIQATIRSQMRDTANGIVWPDNAPISGSIDAALPNIGVWAFFAPPGWRATGSFHADLDLSGTRKEPEWSGNITADGMSLQSQLDGVDLKDGRLRAHLTGSRIDISEIYFQGGEGASTRIVGQSGNLTSAPQSGGTLLGSGFIAYNPRAPEGTSGLSMDLRAQADHLQVLVRADRQLSVSGRLQAMLSQGQFKLDGDLTVDRAAIILADDSAPTLGSDVYITSAATRKAAKDQADKQAAQVGSVKATKPPILNVRLNLGNDFALQGYGITTRLGGELTVTQGPRITGEIHTINGRYRAWGQLLDVEKGTIRFNGPYANPSVDIIAIRPNIDVRAGIKVTGSVNNPRVTLFSEPDMSDAEKLSWILMGRGASGGGAEAALLQQAALALLSGGGNSGNIASQIGFDEIGFRGPSDDGEQGAALTLGKRLSKDLYLTYEQSLSGAMGTLYIFYDLSRRLTLRAQTGEQSAVDLIYTKTSD